MTSNPRPATGQAPDRPGPGEIQDQLRRLRAEGGTYRSIASAGLAPATVHDLATRRRTTC
jgi:hypothetical protein